VARRSQTSDWDDFEMNVARSQQRRGVCIVGRFLLELEEVSPGSSDNIAKALSNPNLTTPAICRVLAARLPKRTLPNPQSFHRHRSGTCSCVNED